MTPHQHEGELIETIERLRQHNKKLENCLRVVEQSYNGVRYENLRLMEDLEHRINTLTSWDQIIKGLLKQVEEIKKNETETHR